MTELHTYMIRLLLFLGLAILSSPLKADIVYPARIQITETSPGIYEVVFILPVINGKILKAEPVFPAFCESLTEPVIQIDPFQKRSSWTIRCEGASLQGQRIGIDGLLGSPIDIILDISTLEGRTYQTTLNPNETYYLIPPPPGWSEYFRFGTLAGARGTLLQWGLALMILALFLLKPTLQFRYLLLILTIGVSLGYYLSMYELLMVPSWAGVMVTAIISVMFLLPVAFGFDRDRSASFHIPLLIVAGMIIGGGLHLGVSPAGYTSGEMLILLGFTITGIAIGVIILGLLVRQLLTVFDLAFNEYHIQLTRFLAGITLGIILWKMSLFWYYSSMMPVIPGVLLGFVISLSVWWAHQSHQVNKNQLWWLFAAVLCGYLAGIGLMVVPYTWAIVLSVSLIFMIALLFDQTFSGLNNVILLIAGGLAAGNHLYSYAHETLSYPHARSLYFILLLAVISLVSLIIYTRLRSAPEEKKYFSLSGWIILIALLLVSTISLMRELPSVVEMSLSEGKLPVPFISLGLLIIAVIIWPRKSRIHSEMGLRRKVPMLSLSMITAACLLLPVCTEHKNPWYSLDEMDQGAMQDLMERRLWNTYTAFNIADEEELFNQLAENLDEDLLDNIYLDSRRRLTMGLREGSQVTVKEVSLGTLGAPESGEMNMGTWKFPASWTVTAQVKHLKHIHYRKNQYTGTIALKPMDEGWKISEINLTSEERQVIASGNL